AYGYDTDAKRSEIAGWHGARALQEDAGALPARPRAVRPPAHPGGEDPLLPLGRSAWPAARARRIVRRLAPRPGGDAGRDRTDGPAPVHLGGPRKDRRADDGPL